MEKAPRAIAAIGGVTFTLIGMWAMISPASFYEAIALFEPYNAHFLRDIGAFQLGLGAVLLLAAFATNDALTAALIGAGVGGSAHLVSHLISVDAGGNPALDIPSLSLLGVLFLAAGWVRWRKIREVNRR